eukprot:338981-Pleurochrysis_carterae.AAC.1
MNAAIAHSILALTSTTAAAPRDAGGAEELDCPDQEIENTADFYEMCDAEATAAYRLKAHGKDNP